MLDRADVKNYLNITDESENTKVDLLIKNVIGFAENYIWRTLQYSNSNEDTFNWYSKQFFLKAKDIKSVSSFAVATDVFIKDWTERLNETDFNIELKAWTVQTRNLYWPIVKITYESGYDCWENAKNPTPKDLNLALLNLCSFFYRDMWKIPLNKISSELVDGDNLSFKADSWKIDINTLSILDNYKIYDFGT